MSVHARARRAWTVFVACAGILVLSMAALSVAILRGERRDLARDASADHARRLRAAAAAIDRWMGPVLAREASRPHGDYASYRSPRRAFSPDLVRLPEGSVLEPSPLLGHESSTILLHVEWSPDEGARSPQVPSGPWRELALRSGLPPQALDAAERRLSDVSTRIDWPALAASVREAAPARPPGAGSALDPGACLSASALFETARDAGLVEDAGDASVGALVTRRAGDDTLVLARDVRAGDRSVVQAAIVDWPALSALLLQVSAAGLPGARLQRPSGGPGTALATLPAVLVADPPAFAIPAWTPQAARLAFAWGAGLAALAALGLALRTSLVHAERRARFAAAVSHELRTPLTTLRLYSEMLAGGVVTDPRARQEYLETIEAESARLASLVENVLLHARLEQSPARERTRMPVAELVHSVAPVLKRRADEAGRPLVIDVAHDGSPQAEVEVDRDAVERVLFNLVDNACKHGADAEDGTLRLEVRRRSRHVDLLVRDQGPGIPRALGTAVFEAFRRGDENGAPGAGLGLALSRSLARDLRGDLSLVPSDRGACFRLSLRVA